MEPGLITYQKFNDLALAEELAGLLEENGIEYSLEEDIQLFNPTFDYADSKQYAVKINSEDFEKVDDLLKEVANSDIGEVDKDYYLFTFNRTELMEVVYKADEWNAFDVQLARKLLAEQGVVIDDRELSEIKEHRLDELRVQEPPQSAWIYAGYLLALTGGILGFFIGWHLWTYKKTLPNGEQLYSYSESDRQHGKYIFLLSFVGLAAAFVYKWHAVFGGS